MKLFLPLYDRVLSWARHPLAERYLAALSFAESSFFPIPPDVMLAPMVLARPDRGFRLALVTTLASVAGGIAGYAIGYFALELIEPVLVDRGYDEAYATAQDWFVRYGFWSVLAAGFSPIPYKVFTIAAGAFGMFLPVFAAASVLGRGARFFLVAGLIKLGGEPMERELRKHVDTLGWISIVIIAGLAWYLTR